MGRKQKVHFPSNSFILHDQRLLLVEEEINLEKTGNSVFALLNIIYGVA